MYDLQNLIVLVRDKIAHLQKSLDAEHGKFFFDIKSQVESLKNAIGEKQREAEDIAQKIKVCKHGVGEQSKTADILVSASSSPGSFGLIKDMQQQLPQEIGLEELEARGLRFIQSINPQPDQQKYEQPDVLPLLQNGEQKISTELTQLEHEIASLRSSSNELQKRLISEQEETVKNAKLAEGLNRNKEELSVERPTFIYKVTRECSIGLDDNMGDSSDKLLSLQLALTQLQANLEFELPPLQESGPLQKEREELASKIKSLESSQKRYKDDETELEVISDQESLKLILNARIAPSESKKSDEETCKKPFECIKHIYAIICKNGSNPDVKEFREESDQVLLIIDSIGGIGTYTPEVIQAFKAALKYVVMNIIGKRNDFFGMGGNVNANLYREAIGENSEDFKDYEKFNEHQKELQNIFLKSAIKEIFACESQSISRELTGLKDKEIALKAKIDEKTRLLDKTKQHKETCDTLIKRCSDYDKEDKVLRASQAQNAEKIKKLQQEISQIKIKEKQARDLRDQCQKNKSEIQTHLISNILIKRANLYSLMTDEVMIQGEIEALQSELHSLQAVQGERQTKWEDCEHINTKKVLSDLKKLSFAHGELQTRLQATIAAYMKHFAGQQNGRNSLLTEIGALITALNGYFESMTNIEVIKKISGVSGSGVSGFEYNRTLFSKDEMQKINNANIPCSCLVALSSSLAGFNALCANVKVPSSLDTAVKSILPQLIAACDVLGVAAPQVSNPNPNSSESMAVVLPKTAVFGREQVPSISPIWSLLAQEVQEDSLKREPVEDCLNAYVEHLVKQYELLPADSPDKEKYLGKMEQLFGDLCSLLKIKEEKINGSNVAGGNVPQNVCPAEEKRSASPPTEEKLSSSTSLLRTASSMPIPGAPVVMQKSNAVSTLQKFANLRVCDNNDSFCKSIKGWLWKIWKTISKTISFWKNHNECSEAGNSYLSKGTTKAMDKLWEKLPPELQRTFNDNAAKEEIARQKVAEKEIGLSKNKVGFFSSTECQKPTSETHQPTLSPALYRRLMYGSI